MDIQITRKSRTACIIGFMIQLIAAATAVKASLYESHGLTKRASQVMQFLIPKSTGH